MMRTSLYPVHAALGARMVDFAGWEMPVQYTTVLDEHRAVRERAGLFDVSHMGDIVVRGEGAEGSLRRLLTNDLEGLPVGKGIYSHILDDQGRIMDDVIVFHLSPGTYLMVPNASRADEVFEWTAAHIEGGEVINVSGRLSCLALQGPRSRDILQRLAAFDLKGLKRFHGEFADLRVRSAEGARFLPGLLDLPAPAQGTVQCYVTRTGYTGEDGFEILVDNGAAAAVWSALMGAGRDAGLQPAGLGARDVLRLEMGYLLSGTDFDGAQTSLETGPDWVVKWDHQFIGRGALLKQREEGAPRKLVGIELQGRGIPRHGYPVVAEGREVGAVTSGTLSPALSRGIALAYVDPGHARTGQALEVRIRDAHVPAAVVNVPFLVKGGQHAK